MVKPGYKQTEVGEIPEDWEVNQVGKLLSITTGNKNTQDKIDDGEYPFYVRSKKIEKINSFSFDCEGVLTAGDGVGTGKVFHYINGKFDIHQRVYLMYNFDKKLYGKYFHIYFSNNFYDRIMSMTAKSSVDSVRREMISGMPLILPTIDEQKAIAKALSDIDDLIVSLEKLIAKKQDIKTAAMQQLLTGKKRLPGFGEGKDYKQTELGEIPKDWEILMLNDLCENICDGTHYTPKYTKDGIPFYSVENVTANNFSDVKYISKFEHDKLIKRCKPEFGDILMTRIGILGDTKLVDWNINASIYVSLALLKPNEHIDPNYLYNYTQSYIFVKNVEKRALTNATPKKINMQDIGLIPIPVPKTNREQKEIAKILSTMEKDINELKRQLDKNKAIKQGMMQELLTGKTRLL